VRKEQTLLQDIGVVIVREGDVVEMDLHAFAEIRQPLENNPRDLARRSQTVSGIDEKKIALSESRYDPRIDLFGPLGNQIDLALPRQSLEKRRRVGIDAAERRLVACFFRGLKDDRRRYSGTNLDDGLGRRLRI